MPLTYVEMQCFALTRLLLTYMLTCLHACMFTYSHAYMFTCLHDYMLTCFQEPPGAPRSFQGAPEV